jgi:hypothetical protein
VETETGLLAEREEVQTREDEHVNQEGNPLALRVAP